jgi:hypothetical protein
MDFVPGAACQNEVPMGDREDAGVVPKRWANLRSQPARQSDRITPYVDIGKMPPRQRRGGRQLDYYREVGIATGADTDVRAPLALRKGWPPGSRPDSPCIRPQLSFLTVEANIWRI